VSALNLVGFSPHWEALLAKHGPAAEAGRVLRHDGVAVAVRTATGDRVVPLRRGLPPVTVGDWLALDGEHVLGILPRRSLLRRKAVDGAEEQLLAANLDLVLLVAGLDRPVRAGRIRRGLALAHDAGADALLVLTKADLAEDLDGVLRQVAEDHPGLDVIVTSAETGAGIAELRERLAGTTSVLLGESGAGKSRLVNELAGEEVALVGRVRHGDRKGRHTTTHRQLHVLPSGGVVIDSPGIREVGLAADEEAVDAAFADLDELGEQCHFSDCQHAGEPGCAIALAIEDGDVSPERVEAWMRLRAEVAAAAKRFSRRRRLRPPR